MHNVKITIYNDIAEYCKIKGIEDVDGYINNLVLKAYMIDKYGMLKKTTDNKLVNIGLNEIEVNKPDQKKINNDNNIYNE
jgi:hypothetical protein